MKASVALTLGALLLLATPLAARADDFAATRDRYVKQMNEQMADWHQKLDQYTAEAQVKGEQAGKLADKDLQQAWDATKHASRRVADATAKGWVQAKAAFDVASTRLKASWDTHTAP